MQKTKNNLKDDLDNFIIQWNSQFPIDRWWRVKHNIPFGSTEHKKANFIQMFLEYREDMIIKKLFSKKNPETSVFDNIGSDVSKKEIDDDFENLDLTEFNEK